MATYTATQAGDWSNNATWGGGGHPIDGDTAQLNSTYDINVDVDSACLYLDCTGYTGTLTMNANMQTYSVKFVAGMIFTPNTYTWTVKKDSTITSAGKSFYHLTIYDGGSGTITLSGVMDIRGNFTVNGVAATIAGAAVTVGGDLTIISAFIYGGSGMSITLNGTGRWSSSTTVSGVGCDVTINTAGTITLGTIVGFASLAFGEIGPTRTLRYTAGTLVFDADSTLRINGPTVFIDSVNIWNNIYVWNFNTASLSLSQPTTISGYFGLANYTSMNLSGGNLTVLGDFQPDGTITNSNTIILGGTSIWHGDGQVKGAVVINTAGTITIHGNPVIGTGGSLTHTSGTVALESATSGIMFNGTCSLSCADGTIPSFGASGTTTLTLSNDLNVTGTLLIAASLSFGGTKNILSCANVRSSGSGSYTLTLRAHLPISGSITLYSNGMTFAGAYNVTCARLESTNDTNTLTLTTPLLVTGEIVTSEFCGIIFAGADVTCSGGMNNLGTVSGRTITLNGSGTITGTGAVSSNLIINTTGTIVVSSGFKYSSGAFTYTAGTVTTTGSTFNVYGGTIDAASITWFNVNFYDSGTTTLSANLNLNGTLSVTSGKAAVVNSNSINVTGGITMDGALSGTSTITLNGSGTWVGTGTSGISNNITINTSGTIAIGSTAYYKTGTITLTSGTVNTTGSRFIICGNTAAIPSSITWHDFGFTGTTAWTLASDFVITGDLYFGGTITFSGGYDIYCVNILDTASSIVALSGDIVATGNFDSEYGMAFDGAYDVFVGGNLIVNKPVYGTATINIVGSGSWSANATSGVFGSNLVISPSSTFTIGDVIYNNGTITYSSGSVTCGSGTISLVGDCSLNTGDLRWNNVSVSSSVHYPLAQSSVYVKATSTYGAMGSYYYVYQATNPALPLIGAANYNSWRATSTTNQRFHIDLGSPHKINYFDYNNWHDTGTNTNRGVQDFTLWGSNTASSFATTTYGTDTGWTQLTCSQGTFDQHVSSNTADTKRITVTNSVAYRYYAFKFANNYGGTTYMGLRRVYLGIDGSDATLSGDIKIAGNLTVGTNDSFLAGSSSVTFDGSSTISKSLSFYNVVINAGKTITLTSGTTQTISNNFIANGDQANLITINSTTPGSTAEISKASGTVSCNYLNLVDNVATGGATWRAGATSSHSNTTGWTYDAWDAINPGSSSQGTSGSVSRFGSYAWITLSASDPAAEIRYTIDGLDPTYSSTPYTGPFKITGTTVRYRAYLGGGLYAGNVYTTIFSADTPFPPSGFMYNEYYLYSDKVWEMVPSGVSSFALRTPPLQNAPIVLTASGYETTLPDPWARLGGEGKWDKVGFGNFTTSASGAFDTVYREFALHPTASGKLVFNQLPQENLFVEYEGGPGGYYIMDGIDYNPIRNEVRGGFVHFSLLTEASTLFLNSSARSILADGFRGCVLTATIYDKNFDRIPGQDIIFEIQTLVPGTTPASGVYSGLYSELGYLTPNVGSAVATDASGAVIQVRETTDISGTAHVHYMANQYKTGTMFVKAFYEPASGIYDTTNFAQFYYMVGPFILDISLLDTFDYLVNDPYTIIPI